MIARKSGPARRRRFFTYTAETDRLLVWDGERERQYFSPGEFLDEELTTRRAGAIYYCHEGGRFDVQVILEEAAARGLEVTASFMGSSAARVTIVRPAAKEGSEEKYRFTFVDSRYLLRAALADMAEWVGYTGDTRVASHRVRALRRILLRAREILEEFRSGLRLSVATAAMDVLQRTFMGEPLWVDHAMNKRLGAAYLGARDEIYDTEFRRYPGMVWDLNSAYGAAMGASPYWGPMPLPGRVARIDRKLDKLALAFSHVRVPERFFPPLPYRCETETGNRLYFPWGEWVGWYTADELAFLEECGGELVEIYESYHFEPWWAPANFAEEVYNRRERSGDVFEKKFLGWIIQALAGKLGQRPGGEQLLINPPRIACPHEGRHTLPDGTPGCLRRLRPGLYVAFDEDTPCRHAWLPAAAFVNARARVAVGRVSMELLSRGEQLVSVATDAVHTTGDLAAVDADGRPLFSASAVGTHLGQWKLQHRVTWAHYADSKLYAMLTDEGEEVVAARGLPSIGIADYLGLLRGDRLQERSYRSIKEAIWEHGVPRVSPVLRVHKVRRACSVCHNFIIHDHCLSHPSAPTEPIFGRPKRGQRGRETWPWHVSEIEGTVPYRR